MKKILRIFIQILRIFTKILRKFTKVLWIFTAAWVRPRTVDHFRRLAAPSDGASCADFANIVYAPNARKSYKKLAKTKKKLIKKQSKVITN